jgi:hypothetical protein
MALQATVTDINTVPEPLRNEYVKTGDVFVLQVDEKGYKTKLDEFRNNNIELTKKQQELETNLAKYKDVDPAKYQQALAELQKIELLEDSQLIKEGKIEDLRKKWTTGVASEWETKYKGLEKTTQSLQKDLEAERSELHQLILDTQAARVFNDMANIRPGAMLDINNRVRAAFTVDKNRKLVPRDPDNMQDEKGNPLDLKGFAQKLLQECPYLFEAGTGGGAGGGKPAGVKDRDGITYVENTPENHGRYANEIAAGKVRLKPKDR